MSGPNSLSDRPYCRWFSTSVITKRVHTRKQPIYPTVVHQDPLARALEPGNRVLVLLTQLDLGALIYGRARLDPKYFLWVSHQPRKFFPIDHVRRRSEFFAPARQTK